MIKRRIVLVHGLWNSPKLFEKLVKYFDREKYQLLIPYLPHKFGRVSILSLANQLEREIIRAYEAEIPIDLVGFSMGGLISRVWLQKLCGASRTSRFISIGSPHNGTYTAQLVPSWLLAGISEMKRGSNLLSDLNSDLEALKNVECISFFSKWDLMVFPGNQAVLPIGVTYEIPVLTHRQLITNPKALEILARNIIRV